MCTTFGSNIQPGTSLAMSGAKRQVPTIGDVPELRSLSRTSIKALLDRLRAQPALLEVATHTYGQGDARRGGTSEQNTIYMRMLALLCAVVL